MDKIIEKKTGWRVAFTKKALPWWLGALLLVFVIYLIARPNNKTLRVDKDTVTISSAVKGEFNDYIRISGRVQPMTTIQLSPQEGGIVEKILIEEGSPVKAGDTILILNNDNLDLQILNSEAELAEKENILRNTQIQMEQQKLDVRQNVLEYGTNVERLRRAYEQQKALYEDKLIAKEEYLKAEEDYQLALQKYNLMTERSRQDSLYRGTQIDRMEESLENMQLNMSMIRKRKSNLIVKASIDGELGLLDVVLGQSIAAGTKIGQINSIGLYKVEAQIDEHYIDRVVAGQHPQRTDLLPEPAAGPAGRGRDYPTRNLLPEDRRQMDLCRKQGWQQGRQARNPHRPPEPAVLRSARGSGTRREGDYLRL